MLSALASSTSRGVVLEPGDILVVDSSNDRILALDPATGKPETLSSGGSLAAPLGIAIEANGDVLVADGESGLLRVDPASGAQEVLASLVDPRDIAIDANGDIFVAAGDSILRFDPLTGAPTTVWTATAELRSPAAIAIDEGGDIIILTLFGPLLVGSLWRIDPQTGAPSLISDMGIGKPWGLAIEANGDILVSQSAPTLILRVDPATSAAEWVSSSLATDLAVESNGGILGLAFFDVIRVDPTTGVQETVWSSDPIGILADLAVVPHGCADGLDNDGDGGIDWDGGGAGAPDPGCDGAADAFEKSPARVCDDGADNEPVPDGLVDFRTDGSGDPGCRDPNSATEEPQCQDGQDNDGDGFVDFDGGLSALGFVTAEPDPQCSVSWRNTERARRCGLGYELATLLPLLLWLQRKRSGLGS